MGVSPFDRAPQTVLWIEKLKIQNSNLTVITIKSVKTRFWMLKPLTVAKFKFEQWFWTAWSWRSCRYSQIVPQRNTHGERTANVISCSHFQFDFQFSRAATEKIVEIQKNILSPGCSSNQTTPRGMQLQTPNPNLSLSSRPLPLCHTKKC